MKLLVLILLTGCFSRVQVEPVTVKPIHVVIDVNVHDPTTPEPVKQAGQQ